jgi:hypothetical protein
VRWLGASQVYHRERADLRGFGYPRDNDASCPHTLGSDFGGENHSTRPERFHAWAGRPVPDSCRPRVAAFKEQKSYVDQVVIVDAFGHWHLGEQSPDKAGKFAGEGHSHLRFYDPTTEQMPAAFILTRLHLPAEFTIRVRLAALAHRQLRGYFGHEEGVLCGLGQDPAGVGVARLGDAAELAIVTGRVLMRH